MKLSQFDQQLIEAVKKGGRAPTELLKVFYNNEAHWKSVRTLVLSKGGSEEDVKDLFQEAMFRMYKNIRQGKFHEKSSVFTYFIGICKRTWSNKLSRKETKMQVTANAIELEQHPKDFNRYSQKELREILDKIILETGPQCSKLLGLWKLNYSMKELAQEFSLKNAAVAKDKKNRCLRKLRALIAEHPDLIQELKAFNEDF